MKAAAVTVALAVLVAAPVADGKPVKCAKPLRVKALSKGCRKFTGIAPAQPTSAPVPMVGTDPFSPVVEPEQAPTPGPTLPPPSPAPAPARLGVIAREWSLTLSRTSLSAGEVGVELQNFGEDAHNLRIERVDGAGVALDVGLAEAGERQKATGTLAAGSYKVYCALPGHDAQGMHARLTVTP
jgi:plastocyanin